jgi:hypothetical protein
MSDITVAHERSNQIRYAVPINIWLLTEPGLFNCYQIAQCPKPSIADSSHNDQMFRTTKGAEAFAVFDNARRQTFANSWKLLEFCGGRCVDIDKLRVYLIGKGNLGRNARLLIVRLWSNRLRRSGRWRARLDR